MTKKRVAINGFGRIGRLVFRNLLQNENIEVVAINDLTDNDLLAHLFKYDTSQRKFNGTVDFTEESLIVNGKEIKATAIKDPAELPWAELNIDVVLECTGRFRTTELASKHISAGAKKVIISAPAKSQEIKTVVLGINDEIITAEDNIVSNASCTTNCLAPVVDTIIKNWGWKSGNMTTIHAYTGAQNLQDGPNNRDWRRARAAAENIVPTTTGSATAVGRVLPEVKGKITAMAVRVPVVVGSMIDLTVWVDKPTTEEEVKAAFKARAEGDLKGKMYYQEDPIVSTDIIGDKHSCIVDAELTKVLNEKMIRIVAWYDNESGYSARLAELTAQI